MRHALLLFFLAVPSAGLADTYYGQFAGEMNLTGPLEATEAPVDGVPHCASADWQNWNVFRLEDDFTFMDPNGLEWTTPAGYMINGASIPQWAWWAIGSPYTGDYFPASVIHDYYVCTRSRTAHDTHRNFLYGMLANGVKPAQAYLMYWAVSAYSDWDLTTDNAEAALRQLDLSDAAVATAFVSALEDVSSAILEQEFSLEASDQLLNGDLVPAGAPAWLSLDGIASDAHLFASAIRGDLATESYFGIAGQIEMNGTGANRVAAFPDIRTFGPLTSGAAEWEIGVDYTLENPRQNTILQQVGGEFFVETPGMGNVVAEFQTLYGAPHQAINDAGIIGYDERQMPWFGAIPN